jgi:uncharacterized protein (DUF302 family)
VPKVVEQIMSTKSINGLVQIASQHSFDETLTWLESTVISKGLTIFARIQFSNDAAKAGLKMNPTSMIIFGNPKAGTPLMIVSPSIAIDFPLKILVSQDNMGKVWVSYNSVEYLKERHNIPEDLLKNIAGIVPIAETVVK